MERRPKYRTGRKPVDPWDVVAKILSGIFMTVGIFLVLMAVSEVIVFIIDLINGNRGYVNWWSTPLMMVVVSIPFFVGYIVVNLNRFAFYRKIRDSISMPDYIKPKSNEMEDIELDR